MHRAFHVERQYVAKNLCPCNGCTQVGKLKLKFVAHIGEVATQTIRQQRKLVGIDVILVHRMLKSPVTIPEYVLLSEDLHRLRAAPWGSPARRCSRTSRGSGRPAPTSCPCRTSRARPTAPPSPSVLSRLGRTMVVAGTGMPYMLGLKRRRRREMPAV